ncbi:MAG TPA: serine/threonine-protein kinase [Thermoanaerobaculia bacterium]|nr:serine/threonine-protein kinase [Thermoanaerobaculia bacterium]
MSGLSDAALRHLREVSDQPDLSGTPYEVVETLGRGGMGTVYLAHDSRLDREVALKVVQLPEGTGDLDRLLLEARVLARLEHPGIVPVHDAGLLPDGRAFYAMKHVRGYGLDEYARTVPLPERLRAFERICEAVAFAHAHGVIHRDLKPENVMVGPFGEVLVMDWGVAKVRPGAHEPRSGSSPGPAPYPSRLGRGGGRSTAHGTILGTPGYMAPEQARGDVARIDERTDVWALGAILAFLLEEEETPPRPLAAICRRAMADEPEERYPKVAELAADLSLYLAGLPVGAHREGWMERIARFARRYRTPILLILAYLLMRVLLIFFLGR